MIAVHQGRRGKYSHAKTGHFFPSHPEKYAGHEALVYKSQLEYLCMVYLDKNPNIVKWNYENQTIKYFDKVTNKVRRYFIDFVAIAKAGNIYKTIWIEVKSERETKPPRNKSDTKAMATYLTNTCKWESASQLAKSKGYEFHVITEAQLKN